MKSVCSLSDYNDCNDYNDYNYYHDYNHYRDSDLDLERFSDLGTQLTITNILWNLFMTLRSCDLQSDNDLLDSICNSSDVFYLDEEVR